MDVDIVMEYKFLKITHISTDSGEKLNNLM